MVGLRTATWGTRRLALQSRRGTALTAKWLIVALLAAALIVILKHRRNRVLGGLRAGDFIAADSEESECPVLVSHRYGLKGRPDAPVRTSTAGAIIPVERKGALAPPRGPYGSDLIRQLPTASWLKTVTDSRRRMCVFNILIVV